MLFSTSLVRLVTIATIGTTHCPRGAGREARQWKGTAARHNSRPVPQTTGRAPTVGDKVMKQTKANSHLWGQRDEIGGRKEDGNMCPALKLKLNRIEKDRVGDDRRKETGAEEIMGTTEL
ncbi:hypothetical protein O1611_g2613 [Lasiodiplodia mahajangana]|uniref:Uncharacterized protein n=1 Tax=Lasiodiplodia mahajangana TaxID=1108764 RepID=A0ACC2JUK6_9PEZI|nr:hypothetical protein O1611_g2613 [Lasiodiplodia mahajangana]